MKAPRWIFLAVAALEEGCALAFAADHRWAWMVYAVVVGTIWLVAAWIFRKPTPPYRACLEDLHDRLMRDVEREKELELRLRKEGQTEQAVGSWHYAAGLRTAAAGVRGILEGLDDA